MAGGRRSQRLDRLESAHTAIGGSGPGRRWVTEELNHALILRLAAEFQGFARDLHEEASRAIARTLAAGKGQREDALISLLVSTRRLDRGNASPEVLVHDFGLLGMRLWAELGRCYPTRVGHWQHRLARPNEARNGLAHDDEQRITKVASSGWPLTLRSVRGSCMAKEIGVMKTLPRIGDRVIVPFGRGGLVGEVIRTSTTLTPPSATVEVWLEGADESTIVTYPADRIRPAEPAER